MTPDRVFWFVVTISLIAIPAWGFLFVMSNF